MADEETAGQTVCFSGFWYTHTDPEVVSVASKSISRAMQRQIDLATAVCQERLLVAHVRHALAMVDLVSDDLAFDDALDIYVRILRLNPEQARNVGSRVLAELGRRSGLPAVDDLSLEAAYDNEDEVTSEEEAAEAAANGRSGAVFSRLRRRLQGRVHSDLRQRINLAAARTEDELFSAQVENALLFVRTLADEMTPPDAVDLYIDTMVLPEGFGDVIYNRALRIVADQILPPVPKAADVRVGRRHVSDAAAAAQQRAP
jgi:hypothetical protein